MNIDAMGVTQIDIGGHIIHIMSINYGDSKHVYNTYNGHSHNTHNSHRYNEDNNQYRHHPRDTYNQNTHFFGHQRNQIGHQRNPMDWPTPMEAELLKALRKVLQSGPNRWGPARG